MRILFSLVLAAGIALASFAAWKTSSYINATKARETAALRQIVPTVDVYVAKKALPFGHILTKEDVVKIAWPKHAVPANVYLEESALFIEDDKKQRTVIRPMEQYEPILSSKVTEPGEDAGMNTRLGKGMRAFAIKVDATSGVSGFLRAGDRVDIYWTGNAAGVSPDMQGEITKLIESGVSILAVDQNDKSDTSGATIARTVTVELTPQQVGRMAQAQMSGRLAMALMGVSDDTEATAEDVDKRNLLGIEDKPAVEFSEEKRCTVRTRKAGEMVEIAIPCATN